MIEQLKQSDIIIEQSDIIIEQSDIIKGQTVVIIEQSDIIIEQSDIILLLYVLPQFYPQMGWRHRFTTQHYTIQYTIKQIKIQEKRQYQMKIDNSP